MDTTKLLNQMNSGDNVEGFFVLKTVASKLTTNGNPFLSMVLADVSGSMDAKLWNYGGPVGPADEGKIVKIRGTVSEYRGSLQMTVERIRLPQSNDNIDLSNLVPCAPLDKESEYNEITQLVCSMADGDYRHICEEMLQRHGQRFREIPAAKSVHHSFLNGLLMHTATMLKTADFLAKLYADIIDRDLLLAGTLLHDFGKAEEFAFSELGLVTEYSVKGRLLGHLVMGAEEVGRVADELGIPEEKKMLLQHMLLSHHGEPEFGAAVRPQCAESELLSLIDLMDSRMEIYRESLQNVPAGSFSGRIFALEKSIYHH